MSKENLIKENLIKEFIKDNNRAPTVSEINFLKYEFSKENPKYFEAGLNAGTKFIFDQQVNKESSVNNFNESISKYIQEQKFITNYLKDLDKESEGIFRVYNNKFSEMLKEIKSMERVINKNLLLHSKDDIYTNGIVESFQDYEKVNFEESNIYMFNGKVTLGFSKVAGENFNSKEISYRVATRSGGNIIQRNLNSINAALKEDGDFFKVLAFSKKPNAIVDFYVELNFEESRHVDTIKFTTQGVESNSKITYRCYYSKDNTTYNECFESELLINNNENYVEINKEDVRSVRIVMSKDGYDYKDGNDYVYIFGLDFLGGTTKKFKINEESTLSLGPYIFNDENGNAMNFSMATIKGGTCCIVPNKTSIDFYLSKDKINWFKSDYEGSGKQVIQFEENEDRLDGNGIFKIYDDGLGSLGMLIEDYSKIAINLLPHQKLLKLYIEKDQFGELVKESLKIKRNICNKENSITYGAKEGWYKNDINFYCAQFEIQEPEGKYLDFGERSCFLNEKQVNGKVFIPYGTHTFKTSEENWLDLNLNIEEDIKRETQLKELDALYPYNHKYVIEGFNYNDGFVGKKRYAGADKVFAYLVEEVSNQKILLDKSLDKFTFINGEIETSEGNALSCIFLMVNVLEETGEGKNEKYDIQCKKRNKVVNNNNELYIKAILRSSDTSVTPKIDQIQVRVI